MPLGEVQANRRDQELGGGGNGQEKAVRGDRGGKLAAGNRHSREEHDRDKVGDKAVDEPDIDLVRQLTGWRGIVAPSGFRHAKGQIW